MTIPLMLWEVQEFYFPFPNYAPPQNHIKQWEISFKMMENRVGWKAKKISMQLWNNRQLQRGHCTCLCQHTVSHNKIVLQYLPFLQRSRKCNRNPFIHSSDLHGILFFPFHAYFLSAHVHIQPTPTDKCASLTSCFLKHAENLQVHAYEIIVKPIAWHDSIVMTSMPIES